jgi:hypothetical protein
MRARRCGSEFGKPGKFDVGALMSWDVWYSTPGRSRADAAADAVARNLIGLLERDPTESRLEQVCVGKVYVELFAVVVPAADAERTAAEQRGGPDRIVTIEPLDDGGTGIPRSRVVTSMRRSNLYELTRDNRINRRALVSQLETIGRGVTQDGLRGLLPWRSLFQHCLMHGSAPADAAAGAGHPARPPDVPAAEAPVRSLTDALNRMGGRA